MSKPNQWATMERLRFIERSAFWRGTVTRADLGEVFGLSMAQASSDLQKYQEMNVGALVYNLRKKRYEGTPGMVPMLQEARLEEAMEAFLAGGGGVGRRVRDAGSGEPGVVARAQVDVLAMPMRSASLVVNRRLFLAVLHRRRLQVRYLSLNSGTDGWRWVRPHAFGHNGSRWHVRAWCEKNRAYRDFTLARIDDAEWPEEAGDPLPPDHDWETLVTLNIRPHRDLEPGQRKSVELDYDMVDGRLRVIVRKAMENYLRDRLGLPMRDGAVATRQLEERE